MKLVFEPDYLALLALISEVCGPNQQPYLVGGAVRDTLLGQPLHDMDFVMGENPTSSAKKLAKRLKAGFFVLDDERNTARVVYHDHHGRYFPLDFVQFTGRDLDEDLHNRDFTINAMAVPLNALSQLIDPLRGQSDLNEKVLRACSDHALSDDPVRVLRGVRLAIQLGFKYAPELEADMQAAAGQLPKTSYERQRDEFFRLLAGQDSTLGLRDFQRFGIFTTLIPPIVDLESIPASPPHKSPLFEQTLQTVNKYHLLLGALTEGRCIHTEGNWIMQDALNALESFTNAIKSYFREEITPGRTTATLAIFSALLHDIGKPLMVNTGVDGHLNFENHATIGAEMAYKAAKRLQLSNAESDWVGRMVRYHHMHLLSFVENGSPPDRRTIYRFYKMTGSVGVAIVFHSLAEILAIIGSNLDRERWQRVLSIARDFLSAWWEHRELIVTPVPLLDGHDLQQIFGIEPGWRIGQLLGQLVEEQASGTIINLDQAQDFIKNRLIEGSEHGEIYEG